MRAEIERIVNDPSSRLLARHGHYLLKSDDLLWLASLADKERFRHNPEPEITYTIDRNINYTNVCITLCKFCAFYRKPGHEEGYVLSHEVIGRKIDEAKEQGATSILLQGGHNPKLKIEYYEELFSFIKKNHPVHLHALSPSEILYIAKISKLTLQETLARLIEAGLGSIPGGGAEILTDRVREKISPYKNKAEAWLDVMREAHRQGLKTSATMMFGHVETLEERVEHMMRIRELQDETGGFTAFIAWTFQPSNTEMDEERFHLYNNSVVDYLRTIATARLIIDNVKSFQASWVTQGPKAGQVSFMFGVNDMGSTMIEENVVRQAGASYRMTEADIVRLIRDAGYKSVRRDLLYNRLGDPFIAELAAV